MVAEAPDVPAAMSLEDSLHSPSDTQPPGG
jgi:hypothetical protein